MEQYIPLIEKKNWLEAFALAILLLIQTKPSQKITQKLCGELLHSPNKGKKALQVLLHYKVVVDGKWPYAPDMGVEDEVDDDTQWDSLAWLICKEIDWSYVSVRSLLKHMGKAITWASKLKRYEIEEFIPLIVKEIRKDEFWNKVITAEGFVRKFVFLWTKFGNNIPKKPWNDFSSLKEIF